MVGKALVQTSGASYLKKLQLANGQTRSKFCIPHSNYFLSLQFVGYSSFCFILVGSAGSSAYS
jgi:hypothetical protein